VTAQRGVPIAWLAACVVAGVGDLSRWVTGSEFAVYDCFVANGNYPINYASQCINCRRFSRIHLLRWPRRSRRPTHRDSPGGSMRLGQRTFRPDDKEDQLLKHVTVIVEPRQQARLPQRDRATRYVSNIVMCLRGVGVMQV